MGRIVTSTWAVLITLLLLTTLRWWDPYPIETLRLKTFDMYQLVQEETVGENVVLYDIGEKELKEKGQWPWPRNEIAQLVADLYNSGASLVVLNFMFPEPDRLGGDPALISVMEQVPIVITQTASSRALGTEATPRGLAYQGKPHDWLFRYPGAVQNIPEIADVAAGVGMVATVPELDGVIRRMPTAVMAGEGDAIYPSLPMEIMRVAVGSKAFQIKATDAGISKVRVRGFPVVETDANGRIWIDYSIKILRNTDVKGKIVIVGLVAEGLTQPVATPRGGMDTHEINARMVETMIAGNVIRRIDISNFIELVSFFLFGIILLIIAPRTTVKWTIPVMAFVFSAAAYGSLYAYNHHRLLIDMSFPMLAGFIIYFQLIFNNFAREFRLKQQIKKQFGTYLSPAMVMILQKNPELLKLGGETKKLSILFCDIRGFTPISEQYKTDPQGLTQLINRFLSPMTDFIMSKDGTIDKYMGDCIMAFWNAPVNVGNHEVKAVTSALGMVDRLKELNDELESEGLMPINIGIGINTGEVVVGNMGSNNRFDYSILGDAANLASRLEGQSKGYGVTIILGEETATAIENELFSIELDQIAVKGKKDAVRIFTVLGNNDWVFHNTNWYMYQQQHEKFLHLYRGQKWKVAEKFATDLRDGWPEMEAYYNIMLTRIHEYMENSPGENWDGVYVATTK